MPPPGTPSTCRESTCIQDGDYTTDISTVCTYIYLLCMYISLSTAEYVVTAMFASSITALQYIRIYMYRCMYVRTYVHECSNITTDSLKYVRRNEPLSHPQLRCSLRGPPMMELHSLFSVAIFHLVILVLCNPQVALSGQQDLMRRGLSGAQLIHALHHFVSERLHNHTKAVNTL